MSPVVVGKMARRGALRPANSVTSEDPADAGAIGLALEPLVR